MSVKTFPIFSSHEPAKYAKNPRKVEKEVRAKNNKKNTAIKGKNDISRAQRGEDVKDFFSETDSINTLVTPNENSNLDTAKFEPTSNRELRKVSYRDQTVIGKQEFEVEEYLDAEGNLRELRYIVDNNPLVVYFPTEKIPAVNAGQQNESYEALLEKLQDVKDYYCNLDSEWWFASEANEIEKKAIQTQLIEIFDLGHDFIEYMDKRPTQYSDQLDSSNSAQEAEFITKINARIQEINSSIEKIKESNSLPNTWDRRLNLIVGMISVITLLLGWGSVAAITGAGISASRAAAEEILDKKSPQIKSKNLIAGVVDLLEKTLKNEKAKPEKATLNHEIQELKLLMQEKKREKTQEKLNGAEIAPTLTPAKHRQLKDKQKKLFKKEAQNLRHNLTAILSETETPLAESQSEQILLSLINEGLKADKSNKEAYGQALQNLADKLSPSEKIELFLYKQGQPYWQSLQELKSLYLVEERNLEEIEKKLREYTQMEHSEVKLASENVVKAAQV